VIQTPDRGQKNRSHRADVVGRNRSAVQIAGGAATTGWQRAGGTGRRRWPRV